MRIEAMTASPRPSRSASSRVSHRRAWMVQATARVSQTARARSTLKPESLPSSVWKFIGG